jgi:hypothetical protein
LAKSSQTHGSTSILTGVLWRCFFLTAFPTQTDARAIEHAVFAAVQYYQCAGEPQPLSAVNLNGHMHVQK